MNAIASSLVCESKNALPGNPNNELRHLSFFRVVPNADKVRSVV